MTEPETAAFARASHRRLIRAEQTGLRLAIGCRTLIVGLAFVWYGLAPLLVFESDPRALTVTVLLAFTAIGVAHFALIGTAFDRGWIKYAVYALDTLAVCATFALVPVSRAAEVPQIIAFRAYGIYFLFPLVAVACLSLSWRLVLWTGAMAVLGWWAAFVWVVRGMPGYLSWADMPGAASRGDYEQIFLSIDFIGRGNRVEETAMLALAAVALAVAVYRARAVFFAQVSADLQWRRERSVRRRVSDLLGQYVPFEIAQRLIADDAPLTPQRGRGTALVMDIADFTRFSTRHPPERVIAALDGFLAAATDAVAQEGGIVMTYLGDGFLVTFNAPVSVATPERAALRAARRLPQVARDHGFAVRVGLASGDLVTGPIGTAQRQSFTVYGDPVNLAARLEAQCKALDRTLLMDAATRAACDGVAGLEPAGEVAIRGVAGAVPVFGLAACRDAPTDTT